MRRLPFLLLLTLPLAGCGGSSDSSAPNSPSNGRGTAVLRVEWPEVNTRLIPNVAVTIVVTLDRGATHIERTITRPSLMSQTSASTTVTGLAYGDYAVGVKAYPAVQNGSTVPVATGAGTMRVVENVPGKLDVAMDSTIATLAIGTVKAYVGTDVSPTLTATATDKEGRMVLLNARWRNLTLKETLTWTSADPSLVKVTGTGPTAVVELGSAPPPNGTAAATTVTATIRVDDAGTVKSASVPVGLVPTLTVAPADAKGYRNGSTGPFGALRTDGAVRIGSGTHFYYQYYYWNATFPPPALPSGATLLAAKLVTSPSSASSSGVSPYDSTTATVTGSTIPDAGNIGSFDVTNAVRDRLARNVPYLGFAVGAGIKSETVEWSAPVLRITYVPAP